MEANGNPRDFRFIYRWIKDLTHFGSSEVGVREQRLGGLGRSGQKTAPAAKPAPTWWAEKGSGRARNATESSPLVITLPVTYALLPVAAATEK